MVKNYLKVNNLIVDSYRSKPYTAYFYRSTLYTAYFYRSIPYTAYAYFSSSIHVVLIRSYLDARTQCDVERIKIVLSYFIAVQFFFYRRC